MKVQKFNDEDSWKDARRGKITGTRLGNLVMKNGSGYKMGFYELIWERLSIPGEEENPMERGKRLEPEAILEFNKKKKLKLNTDLVMWERDDDKSIAVSPDAFTEDLKIAVEAKCLNGATHIKACITQEIPDDYREQVIQYFVVNEKLEKLYFVFYDPRLQYKSLFFLTFTRDELKDKIAESLILEKQTLEYADELVNELSGF